MPDEDFHGAHHQAPESIEATIQLLTELQHGETWAVAQQENSDHQTWAGILAMQLR